MYWITEIHGSIWSRSLIMEITPLNYLGNTLLQFIRYKRLPFCNKRKIRLLFRKQTAPNWKRIKRPWNMLSWRRTSKNLMNKIHKTEEIISIHEYIIYIYIQEWSGFIYRNKINVDVTFDDEKWSFSREYSFHYYCCSKELRVKLTIISFSNLYDFFHINIGFKIEKIISIHLLYRLRQLNFLFYNAWQSGWRSSSGVGVFSF